MPEPGPPPAVYQLRVVLRWVSPLIWRRLLVPADTSLAGLHDILQVVFGWSEEHLHRFVVNGADYDAEHGDELAAVALPASGCGRRSVSSTTTTSGTCGATTCVSSRSWSPSPAGATRAAPAGAAPARPRTAVARGRSWS